MTKIRNPYEFAKLRDEVAQENAEREENEMKAQSWPPQMTCGDATANEILAIAKQAREHARKLEEERHGHRGREPASNPAQTIEQRK